MGLSVAEKRAKWIGTARVIYWTVTLLFLAAMMSAGVTFLAGASFNQAGLVHLGYPLYLLKILGVAKILGGVAILQTQSRALKEWAYAGFAFNLIGASASHYFVGDPAMKVATPLILLAFMLISYRQWKTGWM